ncbi:MAG: HAMP domain-containing histidine kinase [Campylobacterales bacterium]|nr:HAMP domain-containing histidine kinase [Campylobacterales bacterium]
MTIRNRLKLISLLPILIMTVLASYLLFTIYPQFDINNQEHLISAGIGSSIIVLGFILLIYGYITSNLELNDTEELAKLFKHIPQGTSQDQTDNVFALKLDTYKGKNKAYIELKEFIDHANMDKTIIHEAYKAKLFISNKSYEIKKAINGIIEFNELLKSTDINEEQEGFISIIEKNSNDLLAIINNILDLSQIKNLEADHEKIIFDTIEEFEDIIERYAKNAIEKNIDLNFYIDPKIGPKLKGNLNKIKEILNNLLSNAIQFTNPDGEINVEIHKISEESHDNVVTSILVFKVQDNSIGMTKEEQEQIFEPFAQNRFGLAKSNQFAHTMGGHMEVESEIDAGNTFYLTLPIQEIAIENSNLEDTCSNIKIGLYEDDNTSSKLADYIKNYLKFFGAKIKIFKSIKKANSLSEKDKCKFCLIDIDKADPEVIESLSTVDKSKLIVVGQLSNKDKLEQLGFSEQNIIFKPVTLSKIKRVLFNNQDTTIAPDIDQTSLEDETSPSDTKIDVNDSKVSTNEILISKSNDLESKIIAKAAQNMGYSVTILDDSALLLETFKNGKYDILIIDEETIDELDDINDNINIITTNVIEELKSRKP